LFTPPRCPLVPSKPGFLKGYETTGQPSYLRSPCLRLIAHSPDNALMIFPALATFSFLGFIPCVFFYEFSLFRLFSLPRKTPVLPRRLSIEVALFRPPASLAPSHPDFRTLPALHPHPFSFLPSAGDLPSTSRVSDTTVFFLKRRMTAFRSLSSSTIASPPSRPLIARSISSLICSFRPFQDIRCQHLALPLLTL